ncbi:MAG: hypothetical protein MI924_10815 [Chloroflexales bacterium]|nr:hypothetical protein [Chloroflexales bacterium]
MNHRQHELYNDYEALWQAAWPDIHRGRVECDQLVMCKDRDQRRGLTVIARLDPDVVRQIGDFLATLHAIEPQQYYYPSADLHLTILSLFTATDRYHPCLANADAYIAAVTTALTSMPTFALDTVGVTLSRGAVLVQGFPHDATLNIIRDTLRRQLTAQQLGSGLDQRYRLRTAHSTIARFTAPLQNSARFADTLHAYRHVAFGTSTVIKLDVVINDWYMSSDRLTLLKTYELDLRARTT